MHWLLYDLISYHMLLAGTLRILEIFSLFQFYILLLYYLGIRNGAGTIGSK